MLLVDFLTLMFGVGSPGSPPKQPGAAFANLFCEPFSEREPARAKRNIIAAKLACDAIKWVPEPQRKPGVFCADMRSVLVGLRNSREESMVTSPATNCIAIAFSSYQIIRLMTEFIHVPQPEYVRGWVCGKMTFRYESWF